MPKVYCLIALISTMAKVLTVLVAENLSRIVEQYHLLLEMHFRG